MRWMIRYNTGVKFSSSDEPADFTFDVASIADTTGTSVKYAKF